MIPVAPPRLSTTICWPSRSTRRGPIARTTMSVPPPGGYGTTMRIGRDGYCARAAPARSVHNAISASCLSMRFIVPGPENQINIVAMGATEAIAEFISRTSYADFPQAAAEKAAKAIADTFAVILAGAGSEEAGPLLRYAGAGE